MIRQTAILILGAGPTGLGAAYRLHEQKQNDWLLLEQNSYPGGLATTFTDEKGFLWDVGGHVVHSHYSYFDQVFAKHILPFCNKLQREAWVWLADTFIPYPFQYNLRYLPPKIQLACVNGLKNLPNKKRSNFKNWILNNFGKGIAENFLIPQNLKTWGMPLDKISSIWVGDRVATVNLNRVLDNIKQAKDDVSWGPNSVFYYPKQGGTGFIWKTLADHLPPEKIRYSEKVIKVDFKKKLVTTDRGQTYHYQKLISSLPITKLLKLANSSLLNQAEKNLYHSTVHVIGLGLAGKTPAHLKTKCWMYFPDKTIPFFRATVFSNYAKHNVPNPGKQWSLMTEVIATNLNTINKKTIVNQVIKAAKQARLINSTEQVISTWHHIAPMGYPIPTISRDKVINKLLTALQAQDVYSRGRFGAWKYEVSNMDHSFMQGVEAANHLLTNQPEITVWQPNKIGTALKK